jgi:hypothetical protein
VVQLVPLVGTQSSDRSKEAIVPTPELSAHETRPALGKVETVGLIHLDGVQQQDRVDTDDGVEAQQRP